MKYNEIIASIDNKEYRNIYFLSGNESYYIDKISKYISTNILTEEDRSFNQVTLYGKETNTQEIIAESKQYPFGANNRVVIIKEAQHVKNIESIMDYINSPLSTTILVICYKEKKIDKRKGFFKTIQKEHLLFESNKLYENQISKWIKDYCNEQNLSITHESCAILVEHLGTDLTRITNELDKLLINLNQEKEITPSVIEQHIGINKDFNVFELQNSLGKKNVLKSNKIAKYLSSNSKHHPFVLTISSIFSFFKKVLIFKQIQNLDKATIAATLKINPFFISQYQVASRNYTTVQLNFIFKYLRDYELRSKGIDNKNTSTESLLQELIFKILHT